jgi:hypothetical protein
LERRSAALVVQRPDGSLEARSAGFGKLGVFLAVVGALTPILLGLFALLGGAG